MSKKQERRAWRVVTSGPIASVIGTLDEAKAYVERYTPLKRGWVHEWEQVGPNDWLCHRNNSKGNRVKGYTVRLITASAFSPHRGELQARRRQR